MTGALQSGSLAASRLGLVGWSPSATVCAADRSHIGGMQTPGPLPIRVLAPTTGPAVTKTPALILPVAAVAVLAALATMGALIFWVLTVGYVVALPAWLFAWWRSGR